MIRKPNAATTAAASMLPTVSEGVHDDEEMDSQRSSVSASPTLQPATAPVVKSATVHDIKATGHASSPLAAKGQDETFLTQRAGKLTQEVAAQGEHHVVSVVSNQFLAPVKERRLPQSTLIAQKKREMQHIEALLEQKRIEFKARMEECAKKREDLQNKQKQIRERVLKFEKFLKENDSKRQRALIKAQSERKFREQKEAELLSLQISLREYQIKSVQVKERLAKYRGYEEYMQSVVNALPADYLDVHEPHIHDVLMRYKTLKETNDDLRRISQHNSSLTEQEQTKLNALLESKDDQMLMFNSQLGTGQKKMDKVKAQTAQLEQRADEKGRSGVLKLKTLSEAMLAIDNLYTRVLHSFNLVAVAKASNMPVPSQHYPPTAQAMAMHQAGTSGTGTAGASGTQSGGNGVSTSDSDSMRVTSTAVGNSVASSLHTGAQSRRVSVAAMSDQGVSKARRGSKMAPNTRGSETTTATSDSRLNGGKGPTGSQTILEQIAEEVVGVMGTTLSNSNVADTPNTLPAGLGNNTMSPISGGGGGGGMHGTNSKLNVPLGEKINAIQERLVDLTQIAEKAQHFVAVEKQKKAEMAQLRLELMGGTQAKDHKRANFQRRQTMSKIQPSISMASFASLPSDQASIYGM